MADLTVDVQELTDLYEQEGLFTVTATAAGYRTQTVTAYVGRDICHVVNQEFTMAMEVDPAADRAIRQRLAASQARAISGRGGEGFSPLGSPGYVDIQPVGPPSRPLSVQIVHSMIDLGSRPGWVSGCRA